MGLTTCPDCQKEISELAESCPHCGRPMKQNYVNDPPKSKDPIKNFVGGSNEGCFLKTLNTGCLLFFGLIAFLLLTGILSAIFG
ncbi:hypothetical protein CK503_03095 [Aliifodinibius salipaludis]|uniref:Zinc-ribbon domain-containing protein n=1 Tax=Fodinibius salipaludis TaxID=2032627 RepID=A0A2A2GDE3_9BACT|nr:hypothetical protein CK503_03095 [Aliifodinibius salipaludis]